MSKSGEALKAFGDGIFPPDSFDLAEGKSGLWMMTCRLPALRGFLVAANSPEQCLERAPKALIELMWATISTDARLFPAFVAGFGLSGEGFNGEYPFEGVPHEKVREKLRPSFDAWLEATTTPKVSP